MIITARAAIAGHLDREVVVVYHDATLEELGARGTRAAGACLSIPPRWLPLWWTGGVGWLWAWCCAASSCSLSLSLCVWFGAEHHTTEHRRAPQ